eukprot:gene7255-65823_t
MRDRYGYRSVYVATDNATLRADARRLFGAVFGAAAVDSPTTAFDHAAAADAIVLDLVALQECDGLVAKFGSNIARLACAVPYKSLDFAWCMDWFRSSPALNGALC